MNIFKALIATSILATGCGLEKDKDDNSSGKPNYEKSPFALITDSDTGEKPVIEKFGMEKANLNKEYLLRSNAIFGSAAPQFGGNKTRIVTFKKINDEIFMIESTKGLELYEDLGQEFIVAKFPIVDESGSHIYFDLNEGLNKLFLAGDWSGVGLDIRSHYGSVDIESSYIQQNKSIEGIADFVQVAQVQLPERVLPVKNYYRLEPYKGGESFKPTEITDFEEVGYFGISGKVEEDGLIKSYASKFDLSKDITYGITANTPSEYVDAVKEGILYWNKAFGKEVIKVRVLDEGVHAPDYDVNVVQWIDWTSAGFAYADAQMDPRTGEILNSQVFMTSAFVAIGNYQASELIEQSQSKLTAQEDTHAHEANGRLCDMESRKQFLQKLVLANGGDVTGEQVVKLTQDQVRLVVAHEVGHTLGLRHNFAGSLAANYTPEQRVEHVKALISEKNLPKDLKVSSSVMDYLGGEESVLAGRQLLSEVLDYDHMAIQNLYYEKALPATKPLFCTDQHAGIFTDCNRFDYGSDLFDVRLDRLKKSFDSLADSLISSFEFSALGEDGVRTDAIRTSPERIARSLISARTPFFNLMQNNDKYLSIYRKYPSDSVLWGDDIETEHRAIKEKAYSKIGSWDQIFAQYEKDFALVVGQLFEEKMKKSTILMELTPKAKEEIKKHTLVYLLEVEKALKVADVDQLFKITDLDDSYISEDFSKYLFEKAKRVITSQTEFTVLRLSLPSLVAEESAEEAEVQIPTYKYSLDSRKQATTFLHKERSVAIDWGLAEKAELYQFTKQYYSDIIGGRELDSIEVTSYEKQFKRWVLESKRVLAEFNVFLAQYGIL